MVLLLAAGCGAPTERIETTAAYSGFLSDYSMLRAGGEGEGELVYWNPNANFAAFDKRFFPGVQKRTAFRSPSIRRTWPLTGG